MNISKNTWHHQLFTFGDRNNYSSNSNICKYIRGVLAGTFLSLCAILVATFMSIVLLDPIVSILAYWITDISLISFFGAAFGNSLFLKLGTAVYAAITLIATMIFLYHISKTAVKTISPVYADTKLNNFTDVVVAKIKSNHDKICRNINFTR